MQRVIVPNVCENGFMGDSFNHLVQVIEQTREVDSGDTVVWDYLV